MPIVAWYILAVSPAVVLLLLDGGRMLWQWRARRRLARQLAAAQADARVVSIYSHARQREAAKTLAYIRETDPAAWQRHSRRAAR